MAGMENQTIKYLKSEKGNMKEEVAGKIKEKTSRNIKLDLENQSGIGEDL